VGDTGAGQRGAILYTVVESYSRRGIDAHAYIKDVLTRLPSMTNHQIHEILLANWAKTRRPLQQLAS